jgi:hypothetical protein
MKDVPRGRNLRSFRKTEPASTISIFTAILSAAGETENEGGYEMKKRNKHIGSSLDDFLK